jgi:type III pantothenate kinase
MILVEIGNTAVKAVRENSGQRIPLFKVPSDNIDELSRQLSLLDDGEELLLSSVRKDLTSIILEYNKQLAIHVFQYNNLDKITLDYETPETLGIDRVLACAGGVRHTQSDVVVVDAGTACTVDLMTKDYVFKGGVILPGLPMLRYSMKTLTPELPETDFSLPAQFPGKTTRDAIRIGVNGGFIHSIARFIEEYIQKNENVQILITGGDGRYVHEKLQAQFNCTYHENLVFDGMIAWKELNREVK